MGTQKKGWVLYTQRWQYFLLSKLSIKHVMKSEKPSATKKGALERYMQRKEQGYSLSIEMVQSGFFFCPAK